MCSVSSGLEVNREALTVLLKVTGPHWVELCPGFSTWGSLDAEEISDSILTGGSGETEQREEIVERESEVLLKLTGSHPHDHALFRNPIEPISFKSAVGAPSIMLDLVPMLHGDL